MIELRAIKGPTGRLMRRMLVEKGLITGDVKARINYGYGGGGHSNLPTLNAKAGTLNKLQELQSLAKNGVLTVPFSVEPRDLKPPVFGRKIHHTRGKDIKVVMCGRPNPAKRVSDYYTSMVPKKREFRVWAFRGAPIGTYEKKLEYPHKLGLRGRSREVWNWRNGYAYSFLHQDNAPKELKQLGVRAVDALGLDFGAVDIIEGHDGKFYVLEVNTAPGVEGRRQGITSLANHIEKWANSGFPAREAGTSKNAVKKETADVNRTSNSVGQTGGRVPVETTAQVRAGRRDDCREW